MTPSYLKNYKQIRERLISSLEDGTQVAFFGQDLIDISNEAFQQREEPNSAHSDIYAWWMTSSKPVTEKAHAIIRGGDPIAIPEALQAVCNWPWNTVFTSSIDAVISRSLEIPNSRLVAQIVGTNFSASTTTTSLRLVRLFGSVERSLTTEMPPSNSTELRSRRITAIELLSNIPRLIASNGTLFIDGWSPRKDWLRTRDISSCLTALAPGQAYIFGLQENEAESLSQDEDLGDLIKEGIITIVEGSLANAFSLIMQDGSLPNRSDSTPFNKHVIYEVAKTPSQTITARGATNTFVQVAFDRLEWRSITGDFLELNNTITKVDLPKDPQVCYQEFYNLTANGPTIRNIKWILHLAYKRDIVGYLLESCIDIATKETPQEFYLILKGQSGSGKTIAMAQLAVELRERGFPVLYAPQKMLSINKYYVENFCDKIAIETSIPVFLLYDGTQESSEYYSLSQYFSSRGKKCVVVGSSYTFHDEEDKNKYSSKKYRAVAIKEISCTIPITLTPDEQEGLRNHIYKFVEASNFDLKRILEGNIDHFFAIMYRALPQTRGPLEEGFVNECAEGACKLKARIENFANRTNTDSQTFSTMEQALRKALGDRLDKLVSGKVTNSSTTTDNSPDTTESVSSNAYQLINATMLVSRYELQLPQSIALRMLNNNVKAYRGSFTGGLLHEHRVKHNEYAISARHPLEADIWIRKYLPNYDKQWEIIDAIGRHMNESSINEDYSVETEFLIKLFRAIGPQGPTQWSWKPGFAKIAKFIGELRISAGSISPRLQLIESHAARESVIETSDLSERLEDTLTVLDSAVNGLLEAYDRVKSNSGIKPTAGNKKLLGILETERACILGTKIGSLKRSLPPSALNEPSTQRRLDKWWDNARAAWRNALKWNDENSMATDAACWISDERIKAGINNITSRTTVLAEWREALDRYEMFDLSLEQRGKLETRNSAYFQATGDIEKQEEALKRLSNLPDPSAQVLYARFLEQQSGPKDAFNYLKDLFGSQILSTHILLFPLLRLWWHYKTQHEIFFPGERITLTLTESDWHELAEICSALLSFEPENSLALYLSAIAHLHLGEGSETAKTIRTLDRLGSGGSKRSKSLVLYADACGTPIAMSAIFKGNWRGRFALAWCDRIGAEVEFAPLPSKQYITHDSPVSPI